MSQFIERKVAVLGVFGRASKIDVRTWFRVWAMVRTFSMSRALLCDLKAPKETLRPNYNPREEAESALNQARLAAKRGDAGEAERWSRIAERMAVAA